MHKQLLFDLKEENGYFIKNDTGENLGSELKLYCYKSDENNIYLDTPVIEYPDNYTRVKNGVEISLKEEFKDIYNHFFAIISKHKKITSIENLFIEECNSFYSIEINKEVKKMFDKIGLDNLIVEENLFGNYLINMKKKPNGFEILFYVYSKNKAINEILNDYRFKIIKQKIEFYTDMYSSAGLTLKDYGKEVFLNTKCKLEKYSFTVDDKLKLDEDYYFELKRNKEFIEAYAMALEKRVKYLIKLYYNSLREGTNLPMLNFLYFGYTDLEIVKELVVR